MNENVFLQTTVKPLGATTLSGMIFVDKPRNVTSTAVIRKIKKSLHISRVGHLGTLDPFASGLLPVMVGTTTRLADDLMHSDKQYLFTIQFGIETDTLDPMGTTIQTESVPDLSYDHILKTLQLFVGSIQQTPPVYSALKMNGRPLYEYMRATGKLPHDIQTKTRTVHITKCDLVSFQKDVNTMTVRVVCSKGTYVRALARDISYALGTIGMCAELRREKIGEWCVANAIQIPVEDKTFCADTADNLVNNLISPKDLLPNTPEFLLPDVFYAKLSTGNVLTLDKINHPVLFDSIAHFIQKSLNQKFFVSIENKMSVLFLAEGVLIETHRILIKPQKKII